MKKLTFILVIALACFCAKLNAQSITILRTDVDTSRSGFITASQSFGFDIVVKGVDSCNSAAFELLFNQSKYIKYSGYSAGTLGSEGKTVVIYNENISNDVQTIYIGAISGLNADSGGFKNPIVIHLDFVVQQDAYNGDSVYFSFNNAQGVIKNDTGSKIITLEAKTVGFGIHGFVRVWPGDANNDGFVDLNDVAYIQLFLGYGSEINNSRAFKRRNASALYIEQLSLVWDKLEATYADCDGDGVVTVNDLLVVPINFNKPGHVVTTKLEAPNISQKSKLRTFSDTYKRIPILLNNENNTLAVAGKINIFSSSQKIIGMENGEIFKSGEKFLEYKIKDDSSKIEFGIGALGNASGEKAKGILAYLIVSNDGDAVISENYELSGVSPNSEIFPIYLDKSKLAVDVESLTPIIIRNNNLIINSINSKKDIRIFSYTGIKLKEFNDYNSSELNLSNLSNGCYLIEIFLDGKRYLLKFVKIND